MDPGIGGVDVFQDLIPGFEGKGLAEIGLHFPEGGHGGVPLGELFVIIFHLIHQKWVLQPVDHHPADLNRAHCQKKERQEDPDGRDFQAQGFRVPVGDHHNADRGHGSFENAVHFAHAIRSSGVENPFPLLLTILYWEILSFRRRERLHIIVPRRGFLLQNEGKKDLRRGVKMY